MELYVKEIPPYKQAPADRRERENQRTRTAALRKEVQNRFTTPMRQMGVRLTITYCRHKGRSDAVNIIGGIADALNGIAYDDDKQITEIHYRETKGSIDEYHVIVEEV